MRCLIITQNENISPSLITYVPLNKEWNQSQTNSPACCCVGRATEGKEKPRRNQLAEKSIGCHSNTLGSLLNRKSFSFDAPLKNKEQHLIKWRNLIYFLSQLS